MGSCNPMWAGVAPCRNNCGKQFQGYILKILSDFRPTKSATHNETKLYYQTESGYARNTENSSSYTVTIKQFEHSRRTCQGQMRLYHTKLSPRS